VIEFLLANSVQNDLFYLAAFAQLAREREVPSRMPVHFLKAYRLSKCIPESNEQKEEVQLESMRNYLDGFLE